MIRADRPRTPGDLLPAIDRMFELSAAKIRSIDEHVDVDAARRCSRSNGRYTARGWTEWTEGFVYGAALLQFDATGDRHSSSSASSARSSGWRRISRTSACTITASTTSAPTATCGGWMRGQNCRRPWRQRFLRAGAQGQRRGPGRAAGRARRRRRLHSTRSTARTRCSSTRFDHCARWRLSHRLGHRLERRTGRPGHLLDRLVQHARATAHYSVYYGDGRDTYDVRGRVAHESLFNVANGTYRGPNTQAGLLAVQHVDARPGLGDARIRRADRVSRRRSTMARSRAKRAPRVDAWMLEAARATCDFYSITPHAPTAFPTGTRARRGSRRWRDGRERDADPFNDPSRWTVPRRRSPRKVCCGSATS